MKEKIQNIIYPIQPRKRRVAIFVSNIHHKHLTGQQKIGMTLARNLSERGIRVLVVSNSPKYKSPKSDISNDNLELFIIPGEAVPSSYLRNFGSIVKGIRRYDPDILHGHGMRMSLLVSFLGKILRKPTIQTIYDIDVRSHIPEFVKVSGLFLIDQIICSSHFIERYLIDAKIPAKRITVLPYGIEDIWFNLGRLALSALGSKNATVMFWGDVKEDRGIKTLLDAIPKVLERFPSVNFVFAIRYNDAIYREKVREFARIYAVKIIDYLRHQHISEIVSTADVVVLPYNTTTIQPPLTLLESLAAGKAVITTDVEANKELIGENERGILIEPRNPNQLAGAIIDLLSNEEKKKEIVDRTISFVVSRYGWNNVMARIFNLYSALLKDSSKQSR